jgi:glyoxylase-like metal-dependent hydrolase (beta-lactamase superfamily II)
MKSKIPFIILFAGLFSSMQLISQNDEVVIKIDTLTNQVYMLTGQGGNIGIFVGEKQVYMIDNQFARLSDKIRKAISTISDKPLTFMLNTHMHGDHTGGNANFNTDATYIVAHDNVRKRVMDGQKKQLEAQKISQEYYSNMLPEITFSDDLHLYDGSETIMAIHVHDAHTDGDAMIYFLENNVIHMGDTYFAGRYPYIDLNSGGSIQGYINAQKRALMLINEDTIIIPGHGSPSSKAELQANVLMLEDIKSNVEAAIASGATLEEVKANPSIAEAYDKSYGNSFIKPDRLRELFYKGLKKE